MQKLIYNLVKDILEETPFVSFEANDEAMTFTCNQFDNPIMLAITKHRTFSDCEKKSDPNQLVHVINVGSFENIDPYEEDAEKRFRWCRKRDLEEVVLHNIKRVKGMKKIVDNLHIILNTIRMNFFTESIICRIDDIHGCSFMTHDVLGDNNSSLNNGWTCYSVLDNGMFSVEYYGYRYNFFSHKRYNQDELMKFDPLNFCRENLRDEEIFKKIEAY